MNGRRGFTLLEMLAAIGLASIALVFLASAVHSQGSTAIYQMGSADMQQNVRGALDLFRREVRMAGYGMSAVDPAVLATVQVPAPTGGNLYIVNLRGNYDNLKPRGSAAAGATQIQLDAGHGYWPIAAGKPQFTAGQRVSIESALLGVAEVRTITAWDNVNGIITVTPALVNVYATGSPVNEIEELNYTLDGNNVLWRQGAVVADQVSALQIAYILNDGTQVADPSASLANLRSASVVMNSQEMAHEGMTPKAAVNTEIRIRNLAIVRTPALDDL